VVEERLFALRAAARKHMVPVVELPALLATLKARLAALTPAPDRVTGAERQAAENARRLPGRRARLTSTAPRPQSGWRPTCREGAAAAQARPRAGWVVEVAPKPESGLGAGGRGPRHLPRLHQPGVRRPVRSKKSASGGELSRLMLALKVVLARGSPGADPRLRQGGVRHRRRHRRRRGERLSAWRSGFRCWW
jgi:DNA repair protein RecN (Recombination protein N)